MDRSIEEQFDELEVEATAVEATRAMRAQSGVYQAGEYVSEEMFASWKMRVRGLLENVYGKDSQFLGEFITRIKNIVGHQLRDQEN